MTFLSIETKSLYTLLSFYLFPISFQPKSSFFFIDPHFFLSLKISSREKRGSRISNIQTHYANVFSTNARTDLCTYMCNMLYITGTYHIRMVLSTVYQILKIASKFAPLIIIFFYHIFFSDSCLIVLFARIICIII